MGFFLVTSLISQHWLSTRDFSSCVLTLEHKSFSSWGAWAHSCSSQALELGQELWHMGLVALWIMESSQTRDSTHDPCSGRQILNHWTTTVVISSTVFLNFISCILWFHNFCLVLFHDSHLLFSFSFCSYIAFLILPKGFLWCFLSHWVSLKQQFWLILGQIPNLHFLGVN